MPGSNADRYLKLLSMRDAEQAYKEIKSLASSLSDEEHLIRSCIFDLHSAVEIELRGIFFHYFKRLLFLTDDRQQNAVTRSKFEKMIERLGFMDMYRIQEPVLLSWPYPDFNSIIEINKTRNKAAHSAGIEKVTYKDRNPFRDPDCFSQMYFDVWSIKQEITKLFWKTIERPDMQIRAYYEEYGDIGISREVREAVERWFDNMTDVEGVEDDT